MNEKLRNILMYALQGMIAEIQKKQEALLKWERFGANGAIDTAFFKPGDHRLARDLYGDLADEIDQLLAEATELQEILDKDAQASWEAFLGNYFGTKQPKDFGMPKAKG